MTTEQPPIVERLNARFSSGQAVWENGAWQFPLINPDGPEAVALIEELVRMAEEWRIDLLARGYSQHDEEVARLDALLAKVKPSKEEGL
jgi:hypothetical protein